MKYPAFILTALLLLPLWVHAQQMRLARIEIFARGEQLQEKYEFSYRLGRGGVPPNDLLSKRIKQNNSGEIPYILKNEENNIIPFDTMYYTWYLNGNVYESYRYVQTFDSINRQLTRVKQHPGANNIYTSDSLYVYEYDTAGRYSRITFCRIEKGDTIKASRNVYAYDGLNRLVQKKILQFRQGVFKDSVIRNYVFSGAVCVRDNLVYNINNTLVEKVRNVYTYNGLGLRDKWIEMTYKTTRNKLDSNRVFSYSYDGYWNKTADTFYDCEDHKNIPLTTKLRQHHTLHYYPDGKDMSDTLYSYDTIQNPVPLFIEAYNSLKYNNYQHVSEAIYVMPGKNNVPPYKYKALFTYEPTIEDTVATGINDKAANDERVTLFPNPAYDVLNVQLPLKWSGCVEVTITDAAGRLVQSLRLNTGSRNLQLPVAGLQAGSYFVRVAADGKTAAGQFVVQ